MSVHRTDLGAARWCKSSYSNQDGGEHVEVADNVPVRDGKAPEGPALVFGTRVWSAFIGVVQG
ncbi:DUF397 domain-containing protein [Streptomyces sp. AA1529]|uniref:DUF397 domain-containing protein n=1 Tax=Streptomyces sp. AA1529 TaxID=1203257 RepID=UPI003D718855